MMKNEACRSVNDGYSKILEYRGFEDVHRTSTLRNTYVNRLKIEDATDATCDTLTVMF
jgi:hypothetical protein